MVSWVATSRYSSISPQPNWSRPPARKFRVDASIGKRILGNVSPHDGARPGRKPSLRAGMARRVHALEGTFDHSRCAGAVARARRAARAGATARAQAADKEEERRGGEG